MSYFFDSQVHARNGYLAKASHESKRLLQCIFNRFNKKCQIIWYIPRQIFWPSELKDYSCASNTKDYVFSFVEISLSFSFSLSQPQLLFISLSDLPLSFCVWLKGIQLQSIKSVAAIANTRCPTSTPITSMDVSDSWPIEGSYKFLMKEKATWL